MRKLTTLAILLGFLLVLFSGCSLKGPDNNGTIEIKLVDENPTLLDLKHYLDPSALFMAAAPTASSDFDCFMVNVTGSGVSADQGVFSECDTPDNFSGSGIGKLSNFARRNQGMEVQVSAGAGRTFDVYGIYPSIPQCTGSNTQGGSKGYLVGRKVQDVQEATSITIPINCNNCGNPSILNCGGRDFIVDGSVQNGRASKYACTVPSSSLPAPGSHGSYNNVATIANMAAQDASFSIDECGTGGASDLQIVEYEWDFSGLDTSKFTTVLIFWAGRAGQNAGACGGAAPGAGSLTFEYWDGSAWTFLQTVSNLSVTLQNSLTKAEAIHSNKAYFRVYGSAPGAAACSTVQTDYMALSLKR